MTKPGPEIFERYLGDQKFLVPWQYQPGGPSASHAGHDSFSVSLCLNSLRGWYDKACDATRETGVQIWRRGPELSELSDVHQWRTRRERMDRREPVNDYEQYRWQYPQDQSSGQVVYYVRHDSDGHLIRLVACGQTACFQYALTGDYELRYEAPFGPKMDSKDAELAHLISSWRARD
jgi:hypothetical protein